MVDLRQDPRRSVRLALASVLALACLLCLAASARAAGEQARGPSFTVPESALQLVVVSSPTYAPAGSIATYRTFERTSASSPWRAAFGTWQAEIGRDGLRNMRLEGDHTTPTGVYSFAPTIYGNRPDPGGLHEPYHRLVCGDWWDEDPASSHYNHFLHVACGATPPFAARSEPLWLEPHAYPYLAVVDFNEQPTISGADAPGSGIFMHAWMGEPTEGCVALHIPELLRVLRWLEPARHPVIAIGTNAELGALAPH